MELYGYKEGTKLVQDNAPITMQLALSYSCHCHMTNISHAGQSFSSKTHGFN